MCRLLVRPCSIPKLPRNFLPRIASLKSIPFAGPPSLCMSRQAKEGQRGLKYAPLVDPSLRR